MNYISYKPHTRIGNWLFQIAFARLLNTGPLAFYANPKTPFTLLEKFHEIFPDIAFTHELPDGLQPFDDIDLVRAGFRLPEQRDGLLLKGYFQYSQLFDRKQVIRYFPCPERIKKLIDEKYGTVLARPITVGVSVRRGDYLKFPESHPFVGKRYLVEAITRFPKEATYVVCSDDLAWCRQFFSVGRFPERTFIFVENEEVLTQLYIHTFCQHNILSNSTFSWWGAYLNIHEQRRAVFPSMWNGIENRKQPVYLYFDDAEVIVNHYSPLQLCHALAICGKKKIGDVLRYFNFRKHDPDAIPEHFK